MKDATIISPDVYRKQIKELNKGMYKKQQSQEVQLKKIALSQEKRERKALKAKKWISIKE